MISASAPAKIILLGEHAAVYGQPAIAVPVSSLRATATSFPAETGRGLRIIATGVDTTLLTLQRADAPDEPLVAAARLLLQTFDAPVPDLEIRVVSDIPIASGLGSGAAVSTAIMRVLAETIGIVLPESRLNKLVYEVEKLHHGTPSGVDNTVVVYEKTIYFQRDRPVEPIVVKQPFQLVIGDTGQSALTRVAVAGVRALLEREPARTRMLIEMIGEHVDQARQAIEAGFSERVGPLMRLSHTILQALNVSSSELDRLVEAAMRYGALGAKLSGGGRGGNMIALVTEATADQVAEGLLAAGAQRVFRTVVA